MSLIINNKLVTDGIVSVPLLWRKVLQGRYKILNILPDMQDISDYRSKTIKLCNLCLLNQYITEKYAGYHNKVHHP